MSKGIIVKWSEEMIRTIISDFPVCLTEELALRLGVSYRTVVRKARELVLEKVPNFRSLHQAEITAKVRKNRRPNPYKGMKGWSVPGSEAYRWKKGHVPMNKGNAEICARMSASRKALIRREQIRAKYGLEPLTRLNLKCPI